MAGLRGVLLALDHAAFLVEAHPFAALRPVGLVLRDEHVLVAGDRAVSVRPVPRVGRLVVERVAADHAPILVPVAHAVLDDPAVPHGGLGCILPAGGQGQIRGHGRGEVVFRAALVPAVERVTGTGRVGGPRRLRAFLDLLGGDLGAARRVERHRERLRGHGGPVRVQVQVGGHRRGEVVLGAARLGRVPAVERVTGTGRRLRLGDGLSRADGAPGDHLPVARVERHREHAGRRVGPPMGGQRQIGRHGRGEVVLGIALVPAVEQEAVTRRVGRPGGRAPRA